MPSPGHRCALLALAALLYAMPSAADEPEDTDLPGVPTGMPTTEFFFDGSARYLQFINSGSKFVRGDVFGAQNQLAFQVEPIVLTGIHTGVRFLDRKGWETFGLRGSYETDRAFSSGGSITSKRLSSDLGLTGTAADVFEGVLTAGGVTAEIEYATFTSGRVQIQDVATGTPFDDAPLVFTRVRADATIDLSRYLIAAPGTFVQPTERRSGWYARATYYQLELPRIVYLTQMQPYVAPGQTEPQNLEVVAVETPPQDITMRLAAVGGTGRVLLTNGKQGYVAGEITAEIGPSWFAYYLPARLGQPAGPTNRVDRNDLGVGIIGRAGLDGDLTLLSDDVSLFLHGTLAWEQYFAAVTVPGEPSGKIGFADAFFAGAVHLRMEYDVR